MLGVTTGRAHVLLWSMTACSAEPPIDLDTFGSGTSDGDTGEDVVIRDGEGRGTLWPFQVIDCEQDDLDCNAVRFALVIGAPEEDWSGTLDSGQVSMIADQHVGGTPEESLSGLDVIPATIVEGRHDPSCANGQAFAWQRLENRRLGSNFSFWSRGSLFASAATAGAMSGRVMLYNRCRSCALFPRPDGGESENLKGGHFGAAVAVGFMAEGPGDQPEQRLAIGAPFLGAGRVGILAPGPLGWEMDAEGTQECQCDANNYNCEPWIESLAGGFPSEEFGAALAVGDLDCDGYDDLIVGAPGADLPSMAGMVHDAGAVYVYLNSPGLLGDRLPTVLRQGTPEVGGEASVGDRFGTTLAVGNFNGAHRLRTGQSCFDFAVGTPSEGGHGEVQIFEGGPDGVIFGGPIIDLDDVFDATADDGDQFGWALLAMDVNFNGYDDLVIGAPGDENGGSITIIPGTAFGLEIDAAVRTTQSDLGDDNVEGDQFGYSLSSTRLATGTSFPYDVLVIGVPGENQGIGRVAVYRVSDFFDLYAGTSIWQDMIQGDLIAGDRFGQTLLQPRAMPGYLLN